MSALAPTHGAYGLVRCNACRGRGNLRVFRHNRFAELRTCHVCKGYGWRKL